MRSRRLSGVSRESPGMWAYVAMLYVIALVIGAAAAWAQANL